MAIASSRNGSPPSQVRPSTAIASTIPEITRSWRLLIAAGGPSVASERYATRDNAAEPAFARRILLDRGCEMVAGEIRPVAGQEDEFAVGGLPRQEIGETQFAASANDEIRIRNAAGVQEAREDLGGY